MPPAADLNQAADFAEGNMFPLWKADTLQVKVIAFWQAVNAAFPDQAPNNHPVGNWLAIIAATAPNILPFEQAVDIGVNTLAIFLQTCDYIYRLFKVADANRTANLITGAQATALLAAYNAQFA